MKCSAVEKLFTGYLEKSLNQSKQVLVKSHLDQCKNCSTELANLAVILSEAKNIDRKPVPESVWQSIEAELDAEPQPLQRKIRARFIENINELIGTFDWLNPTLKLSGALALIFLGIFIGRIFTPASDMTGGDSTTNPGPNIQLAARTENYIEKSKILFLGLVNTGKNEFKNADFSQEKKVAGGLISEAEFLKTNLSEKDHARLKMLIEDLELILLEIANLENKHDVENIELIKSGIEQKGLLLKIHFHDLQDSSTRQGRVL